MSQTKIRGGFAMVPHWMIRKRMLSNPNEYAIMIVLMDHSDSHQDSYPSMRLICEEAGISKPTAIKTIKALAQKKLIEYRRRVMKDGSNGSNMYHVNVVEPYSDDELVSVLDDVTLPGEETSFTNTVNDFYHHGNEPLHKVEPFKDNHLKINNTPIAPNGGMSDTTPEDSETDNQTDKQSALFDAPPAEPVNKPKRRASTGYTDDFEAFWAVYPLKLDKRTAFKAFRSALKRATFDEIMTGAERYANDPNLPEPRFIKHASTWLNGDGWDNPPLPSSTPASGRPNRAESTFNNAVNIARQFYEQEYGSAPQDTNLLGGLQ